MAAGRGLRPAAPDPALRVERGRRAGLVQSVRRRLPRPREKGGADTGPSSVDRRKTGSKHHLIYDGRGTPLKVITTAANVNDITQT
ncbi:IS5/IS1182 family transposase, partial [Streptomyces sp. WAC02707]|uniref:transposase n=1 Tax=Streptomyces sp. WAC02707 TaxID=2487417 RepID=UPI000FA1CEF4